MMVYSILSFLKFSFIIYNAEVLLLFTKYFLFSSSHASTGYILISGMLGG